MCFSSEVSLGTFVFSWAASLYVINTRSLNFIQLKRDVGLNMHHNPINVLLAQWIARRTSNPEVTGSSPV